MIVKHICLLSIVFCIALQGCATIFNGPTQDMPIEMMHIISVSESDGTSVPVMQKISFGDTITYITLQRSRDHFLRFRSQDYVLETRVASSPDYMWVFTDLFPLFVPLFVDIATADWNTFQSLKINFGNDTSDITPISISSSQFPRDSKPRGGIVLIRLGITTPFATGEPPIFWNSGSLGLGYEISKKAEVYLCVNGVGGIRTIPDSSRYRQLSSVTSFRAEGRL